MNLVCDKKVTVRRKITTIVQINPLQYKIHCVHPLIQMPYFSYKVIVIAILLSVFILPVQARQVLIHLDTQTNSAELATLYQQGRVVKDLSPLPWLVVDIAETNARLRQANNLAIYEDIRGHFASTPTDPLYAQQWHLDEIGVPDYWNITRGEGVTIALLDSGVDPNHPDLKDNILFTQGYDFGDADADAYDANGHGTAMAGLMVAQCDNAIGGCGVAPQAKIIPYKLNQTDSGSFSSATLATAILAAADSDAQIISMSLVLDESAPWVEDALRYAQGKNKLLVAAAGNDNLPTVAFPANLPFVVGVGAFTKDHERFGNYGEGLKIIAPGVSLWTTQPGKEYVNFYTGTSPATALVSATLALLIASHPTYTAPELIVSLITASQDPAPAGWDEQSGFGQLHLSSVQTTDPHLQFSAFGKMVYHPNEQLNLDLFLTDLRGQSADLYLRINLPIDTQRISLYQLFNAEPTLDSIPFNQTIISPFPFTDDLQLSLFGENGLLIRGALIAGLTEGIYEVDATLITDAKQLAYQRQILWISAD
ncbi:S8 family serine peptidase [Beggiatoa leptomitoformis]|nr:S8 family serine peptidase [Beggiatoa leptomitoformis]